MRSARQLVRTVPLVIAVALSTLLLAGCGAISERFGSGHGGDATTAVTAEAEFAQMMIPHHEQAVEMAQLAATRSTDPVVLELAGEIAAAQGPEIDRMTALLATWGVPELDDHSGHDMAGMMGDDEMTALAELEGPAFDRAFLTMMIAHHEGAITMAQPVVGSQDPAVRALAKEIVEAQTREIAQMRSMLAAG